MSHTVRIHEHGGPEVLRLEDIEVGKPGPGEVRVRHTAIGINYVDTYHRTGLYPVPLPSGLGVEAVGVVEAVGLDVIDFAIGDRVGYNSGPPGAYSEARLFPAARLVKVPAGIADDVAAGGMLKGMTVEYLVRRTFPVKAGQTVLWHAAAGGVGLIACQWLRHLGVTVIGTVSSDEKAELARAHGAHHTIIYTRENFTARVRELTEGKGVPVVFDSVGKDTFEGSLDCLSPRGMLVSFGNASGPAPAFSPLLLSQKGSLFFTRASLAHYTATRADLDLSAAALFDVMLKGAVKVDVRQKWKLADVRAAHRSLESRQTTGSSILLP